MNDHQPKIVLVGAGSTVFAKNLVGDILSYPELARCRLTLFDVDEERLRDSERVAPTLATTTQAMASHWDAVRNSWTTTIPASAAAAGSRLIRMPKTDGRIVRSAVISHE